MNILRQVASIASKVRNQYLALIPINQAVQVLCSVCIHEKDRLKASALKALTENMAEYAMDAVEARKLVSSFCDSGIYHTLRTIFPAISHCLFSGSPKGEMKVNAGDALKALQRNIPGIRLWQWANDLLQQDEIKRLTS